MVKEILSHCRQIRLTHTFLSWPHCSIANVHLLRVQKKKAKARMVEENVLVIRKFMFLGAKERDSFWKMWEGDLFHGDGVVAP